MLIVFARAPVAGAAKTRLQPHLDINAANALYTAMFIDTLALARKLGAPVLLSMAGESHLLDLPPKWTVVQQPERSFGERMSWSFGEAFRRGARQVVLIGADLPHLPPQTLREAFAALGGHDTVLGPTHDGGYYLIGLNDVAPWLFDGIAWSTADVFGQTLRLLERRQKQVALLTEQRDIDTLEDALAVAPLLRERPELAVLTARQIRGLLATG
jgi:rSAM/selenodomain-associated transferase 1